MSFNEKDLDTFILKSDTIYTNAVQSQYKIERSW